MLSVDVGLEVVIVYKCTCNVLLFKDSSPALCQKINNTDEESKLLANVRFTQAKFIQHKDCGLDSLRNVKIVDNKRSGRNKPDLPKAI